MTEPSDAEQAVGWWTGKWADNAAQLGDAVGVIHDLCEHATPIAFDENGFVATGYTVTVGAVHRALAWLQGASGLQGDMPDRVQTWDEYEIWLATNWPGRRAAMTEPATSRTTQSAVIKGVAACAADAELASRLVAVAEPLIKSAAVAEITALLKRAAEGRREYVQVTHGDDHEQRRTELEAEARAFETAAALIAHPLAIWKVIPSWRWTDEEIAAYQTEDGSPV